MYDEIQMFHIFHFFLMLDKKEKIRLIGSTQVLDFKKMYTVWPSNHY